VLFDAVIDGKPRKLLAQASRCGYFFVLDRTNGKALVSKPYSGTGNWAKGIDEKGQPIPDPAKEPQVEGSLIDTPIPGGTNWQPPSYSPETELFYVNGEEGYGIAYLYDTSAQPEGYGGGGSSTFDAHSTLFALDIHTGATRWKHSIPQGQGSISGGILTTSGKLLFTGDSSSLTAFDPVSGKILWHNRLAASVSNGPSTWMLDGKQYLIVGAGDTLYAYTLAGAKP
jgi:alcohol dehydrogenase (cytochrome c)